MSVISSKKIADKFFYGIIALLVLVLASFGALITHQRVYDVSKKVEKRMETAANYLERVLPAAVSRLDARNIHKDIEATASTELQAVEIFDSVGERIYVYERSGSKTVYDRKIERDLIYNGNHAGRMVAYFSIASTIKPLLMMEFLRLIVLISAGGLVLGAGLYFLVKKIILKPINVTLAFSKDLASGNYNKRIDVASKDEMGLLQGSLNKMADALQESVENLKSSFYEAEGARQQALESSRLKSEFLASMSHEIRTPINAIVGFADLLLEDERDESKRENLKTIKKSANMLLENISDILDLSKIEAGKLKLTQVEFLLDELIEEISPIISLRLHGKEVAFNIKIADELKKRPLLGDRIRLRQVLLNVLINATKFTQKGMISLFAGPADEEYGKVLFQVSDTGIGIPKEYHERVFDPFTQVDGSMTREYGGTGLGLAIAKRLVDMMNGKIWLESVPGNGTTFYFTVEIKSVPAP